jgi:hypothetical protein
MEIIMLAYVLFILTGLFFGSKMAIPLWWKILRESKNTDKVINSKLIHFVGSLVFFGVSFVFTFWWTLWQHSWAPISFSVAWIIGRLLYNWWEKSGAGESV